MREKFIAAVSLFGFMLLCTLSISIHVGADPRDPVTIYRMQLRDPLNRFDADLKRLKMIIDLSADDPLYTPSHQAHKIAWDKLIVSMSQTVTSYPKAMLSLPQPPAAIMNGTGLTVQQFVDEVKSSQNEIVLLKQQIYQYAHQVDPVERNKNLLAIDEHIQKIQRWLKARSTVPIR